MLGVSKGPQQILHGYVEGGTLCKVEYLFSGVTPELYANGIPVDLSIRAFRSYKGKIEQGIRGSITMKHPTQEIESNPVNFAVNEYQVDEKTLDLDVEGTADGETRMLNVFEDLVDDRGRLMLVLRCIDDGQYLGMTRSGVYLHPSDVPFAWNFAKAFASIWLQMVVVIAFGVMFSTFLTGSVAMVATAMIVLLGFGAEQVMDTRHYIDQGQNRGGGPLESLVRILRQDAMTTDLDLDVTASRVIKTIDAGIIYTLDATVTALPNLPKMISTAEYAASGFNIFGALLSRHAVAAFGYALIAFFIGYFFLKTREIAA
ncbi:MAG: hypothetical protein AAF664_23435 [Planctomycetota bacterium]